MKQVNPDHLTAIMQLINTSPFFSLLSLRITKLDHGYCQLEVDLEKKHLNPFGGLHGGVYSSAIDTAAYWSVYCDIPEGMGLTTLDLQVDNLSAVQSGKLIIEGKQLKRGRTICLSEASVRHESGKLLALGRSKQIIIPHVQTMDQALAAMEYAPLPAKFME